MELPAYPPIALLLFTRTASAEPTHRHVLVRCADPPGFRIYQSSQTVMVSHAQPGYNTQSFA